MTVFTLGNESCVDAVVIANNYRDDSRELCCVGARITLSSAEILIKYQYSSQCLYTQWVSLAVICLLTHVIKLPSNAPVRAMCLCVLRICVCVHMLTQN